MDGVLIMALRVIIPQIRFREGSLKENLGRILRVIQNYDEGLILFPELALIGYYAGDLTYYLAEESQGALERIADELSSKEDLIVGVGYPELYGTTIYNSYSLIDSMGVLVTWRKFHLPTFGIFEEHRYFKPADTFTRPFVVNQEFSIGVAICYDAFFPNVIGRLVSLGAEIVIVPSASPIQSRDHWDHILKTRALENNAYIIYVNHVGFRDNVFFYGESRIINPLGEEVIRARFGEEDIIRYTITKEEIVRASTHIRPTFRDYRQDIDELPVSEEY